MDRSVGPYRLLETLGTPPFGELAAASHPARSEALAVLLFAEPLGRDHRFRGLLRLEMARAAGLRHPALARTVEVGEHAGAPYLVVERPAGGELLVSLLARGAPPDQSRAVAMVRQLAEALDAAHGRRLVHGALSPGMVLVGTDGAARLLGVGLLAALDDAGLTSALTEQMDARFAAPEQQTGRRAVASADGYSLGILAGLLLGQHACGYARGAEAGTAEGKHGESAAAVLARQTAAEVAQRYATCAEFAVALAAAVSPAAVASPMTASGVASPLLASPPTRTPLPEPPAAALSVEPPVAALPVEQPAPDEPAPVVSSSLSQSPADASSLVPPASAAPPATSPGLSWSVVPEPAPDAPAHQQEPVAEAVTPTEDVAPLPAAPPISRSDVPVPAAPAVTLRAAPASRPPEGLGNWLRAVIDPPTAAPPTERASVGGVRNRAVALSPEDSRAALPDAALVADRVAERGTTVTNSAPTPAMLACVARIEQRDLLTEGLGWIASAYPPVERGLSAISKDGKTGPLPTGVVLVLAVALILLLLRQFFPAAVLVACLVALQWLPRLVTKLTTSDWAAPDAVSVTGPARLRRRRSGPFGELFELELGNGMVINLRRDAYGQLLQNGNPLVSDGATAQDTGAGTRPPVPRMVEHVLPAVTATYLSTSRLLFDVRAADGTVLVRHPEYAGEPGDIIDGQTEPVTTPGEWQPVGRGRSQVLPFPATVQAALYQEQAAAQGRAVALIGGPLLLLFFGVTSSLASSLTPILLAVVMFVVILRGIPAANRAILLGRAGNVTTVLRVNGPAHLTEERSGKTRRYALHLEDEARLPVDVATHRALARLGTRGARGGWAARVLPQISSGQLLSEHDLPALTVTYEPTAPLLLEIHNPYGASVYRDAALPPGSLGDPGPSA